MATTCLDNILCENAWNCNITVLDENRNPIDPLNLNDGDNVVFVLGEKPGYSFRGWVDEDGIPIPFTTLGNNTYLIRNIDCSKQYLASYCADQYTVNVSGTSGCFRPYTIYAHYGDIVQIDASDSPSCRFVNWTKNGVLYSEVHSFEHVVTENVTFVANYEAIQYLIVSKPNKLNRGTCAGGGLYGLHDTATLTAEPAKGYYFSQWNDGITNNPRTVTVLGNKTYVGVFEVGENNIDITPSEGGAVVGGGTYETGKSVSLQAVPDSGWKFSHWLVDGVQYNTQTLGFIADEDKTVVPFFERNTYQISLQTNTNGVGYFIPSVNGVYSYGDTFTAEAFANDGYEFVEWKDGFTSPRRQFTVVSDANYVAVFKRKDSLYEVKVNLNGAVSCVIYSGYVNVSYDWGTYINARCLSGTKVIISPVIPEGKHIVSMTDGGGNVVWIPENRTSSVEIPYVVGDDSVELTLNFEISTFTVSLTVVPLNEDTTGLINIISNIGSDHNFFRPTIYNTTARYYGVSYGETAQFSVPSTVGNYVFSYWTTQLGSFRTSTINLNVTRNLNCTAVYILNTE